MEGLADICFERCDQISTTITATITNALLTNKKTIDDLNLSATKIVDNLTTLNYAVYETKYILIALVGFIGLVVVVLLIAILIIITKGKNKNKPPPPPPLPLIKDNGDDGP
jgi:hypothetical protein